MSSVILRSPLLLGTFVGALVLGCHAGDRKAQEPADLDVPWLAGDVIGTVVDEAGDPIEGVEVSFKIYGHESEPFRREYGDVLDVVLAPGRAPRLHWSERS